MVVRHIGHLGSVTFGEVTIGRIFHLAGSMALANLDHDRQNNHAHPLDALLHRVSGPWASLVSVAGGKGTVVGYRDGENEVGIRRKRSRRGRCPRERRWARVSER